MVFKTIKTKFSIYLIILNTDILLTFCASAVLDEDFPSRICLTIHERFSKVSLYITITNPVRDMLTKNVIA